MIPTHHFAPCLMSIDVHSLSCLECLSNMLLQSSRSFSLELQMALQNGQSVWPKLRKGNSCLFFWIQQVHAKTPKTITNPVQPHWSVTPPQPPQGTFELGLIQETWEGRSVHISLDLSIRNCQRETRLAACDHQVDQTGNIMRYYDYHWLSMILWHIYTIILHL